MNLLLKVVLHYFLKLEQSRIFVKFLNKIRELKNFKFIKVYVNIKIEKFE